MGQFTLQNGLSKLWSQPGAVIFAVFALALLAGIGFTLAFGQLIFTLVPFGLFGVYLAITDLKALFILLWVAIPFSTEMELPGGFGTDFPDEPIMLLLAGAGVLFILSNLHKLNLRALFHPVCMLLCIHYAWIWISTIQSDLPTISVKFALAKSWYILVFFLLTYLFMRDADSRRKWFLAITGALGATALFVFYQHLGLGLSFDSINQAVVPFYRNHVSYAVILAVIFPFLWYANTFFRKSLPKWLWIGILGFAAVALYFSYTRAAYLAVFVAIGWYFIMQFKLVRPAIFAACVGAAVFFATMANNNRYIDYAPDYAKTITHYKFDNLLEATYKFEDISTMERFYRWIAGFYMLQESPVFGFGPGNFYHFYRSFTDENFVTYVSDNPERSGTHNYFLMTATDQGIPGFFLFLGLCAVVLITGERLFHRLQDRRKRAFALACTLSFVIILFTQLFNDLIETDKVGSFFFFNMACLVYLDIEQKQLASAERTVR